MAKIHYIYKATAPDGTCYIGITATPIAIRIKKHIAAARKGSKYKFHLALLEHKNDIKWQTLCCTRDLESAEELEKELIKLYDSYHNGYNSTTGGKSAATRIIYSDKQIEEVRYLTRMGASVRAIAKETGISKTHVCDIQNNKYRNDFVFGFLPRL